MGPEIRHELELYASHFQFYVVDAEGQPDAAAVWDGRGLERHLGVAPGIVAVGTVGYTFLPVVVEIWGAEPPLDDGWDHVGEATLELRSGRLALATVDGVLDDLGALEVGVGTFRVRASGGGLDGATEMDGGDRWRVQVWAAPPADPAVLRCWPPWNPAAAEPTPTTREATVLVGAEATDARAGMRWLASRGSAHLFVDSDASLWEHSSLPTAAGTPQLEQLAREEAERRYGSSAAWGETRLPRTGIRTVARSLWQTWRYSRGWRPKPDPEEPVFEEGRRVLVGSTAVNRMATMRWIGSEGGDSLYADGEGALWEWRNAEAAAGRQRLFELSPDEARAKYGTID